MSSFWSSGLSMRWGLGIVRLTDVNWPEDMTLVYRALDAMHASCLGFDRAHVKISFGHGSI